MNGQSLQLVNHDRPYGSNAVYPDEIGTPVVDRGSFEIQGSLTAELRLTELDQVFPAGSYRWIVTGDQILLQRNGGSVWPNPGITTTPWDTATTIGTWASGGQYTIPDDISLRWGTDGDIASRLRSTTLGANTALTGVIVGTPVTPAIAANSFILSNVTADGDILVAAQTGGNSQAWLWVDSSAGELRYYGAGTGVGVVIATAHTILDNILFRLGTDGDQVFVNRSTTLASNTALTNVLIGTVVGAAIDANSLIVSNVTAAGDLAMYGNRGGNSEQFLFYDSSAGVLNLTPGQSLVIDPVTTMTVTVTAATAAAFVVSNAAATFYSLDTRTTTGGSIAHAFDMADPTIASAAGAVAALANFAAYTLNLTGITDVTTEFSQVIISSATIAGDTATVAVTSASALRVSAPLEGTNVAITASAAIHVTDSAPTSTLHYGLWVARLTGGARNAAIAVDTGFAAPAATTDRVGIWAEDIAAGDARWGFQSEGGSAIYLGNDILRFAATTGIIGIGATTVISSTSTLVTVPIDIFVDVGIRVGANSTNNEIDDATQGAASTQLFIGNASINVTSDVRVKHHIEPYLDNALALLHRIPVVEYDMSDAYRPFGGIYYGRYVGMTAQALYETVPWAVNTQGGEDCWECRAGLPCEVHLPWQVKYDLMTGLFVKGFQEMDDEVTVIKQQLVELQTRLLILEGA